MKIIFYCIIRNHDTGIPHFIEFYIIALGRHCIFYKLKVCGSLALESLCVLSQSCPTLCGPWIGSFVHDIFQATILEWVAISCSRASSQPRDEIRVSWASCISRQILHHCNISKPADTIFPEAFAHFMSLCHILVILAIFQTFSLLFYLFCWSVIRDFWCYFFKKLQLAEGSDDG